MPIATIVQPTTPLARMPPAMSASPKNTRSARPVGVAMNRMSFMRASFRPGFSIVRASCGIIAA